MMSRGALRHFVTRFQGQTAPQAVVLMTPMRSRAMTIMMVVVIAAFATTADAWRSTVIRSSGGIARIGRQRVVLAGASSPGRGTDLYKLMDVSPRATDSELRKAYARRARAVHPDVNPSPEAAEEFQRVTEAYAVLRDERTRERYDNERAVDNVVRTRTSMMRARRRTRAPRRARDESPRAPRSLVILVRCRCPFAPACRHRVSARARSTSLFARISTMTVASFSRVVSRSGAAAATTAVANRARESRCAADRDGRRDRRLCGREGRGAARARRGDPARQLLSRRAPQGEGQHRHSR